jgi:hypothetical protein
MSNRRAADIDRAGALRVLAESAAGNDGTPVWAACARLTGLDRQTLRRIWAKRGTMRTPSPAPTPSPPPSAPPEPAARDPRERARELLRMGATDFREEALAELIRERDLARSDTARAQLTVKITEYAQQHRPPEEAPVDESTMGREAWEQWIVGQARELVDRDLELMLAVYAERHKARLVLVGQGGHRAELVDGTWVQGT